MFIDLLGFGLIIPILPIYSEDLGASGWMIGIIVASYSIMQFVFAPLWGSLSDRLGRKPVLMMSVGVTVLAYLFFANATTLLLLLLSRAFSGVGSANISVAQAYISDVTPPEGRAKAFGIIGVAFGLGFIFGPPIGGYLKEFYGIKSLGYTAACLAFLNLTVIYLFINESNKYRTKGAIKIENPFSKTLKALTLPTASELLTITLIYVSGFSMMHITASLLWSNQYGCSEAEIGYIFAFIGFAVVLVQGGAVGPVSKRWGERAMLKVGTILMAIGLGSMPFVPGSLFMPLMFLSLVFIALGNGFVSPAIQSILSQTVSEKEQGMIMGANQSLSSLGRILGPIIGASFYDWDFRYPYVLSAVLMIVCWYLSRKLS